MCGNGEGAEMYLHAQRRPESWDYLLWREGIICEEREDFAVWVEPPAGLVSEDVRYTKCALTGSGGT